jgi:hypothetical protein
MIVSLSHVHHVSHRAERVETGSVALHRGRMRVSTEFEFHPKAERVVSGATIPIPEETDNCSMPYLEFQVSRSAVNTLNVYYQKCCRDTSKVVLEASQPSL